MSASSILSRLRTELRDPGSFFSAAQTSDGVARTFDLPVEFVRDSDLEVFVSGQSDLIQTENYPPTPGEYWLDPIVGKITLPSPLNDGDILVARGWHWKFFTDDQLMQFINTAFLQHTVNRYPTVTLDTLPGVEEYLVVLLALVEALWVLATEASYEIDILTPDGVQIPREQRFSALMQMIQAREAEYRELAQQLNVGLFRIEMFNLRRVSRSTNRLVPIYTDREYDDNTYPHRLQPAIDVGGMPIPSPTTRIDLELQRGEAFSFSFSTTLPLSGATASFAIGPDEFDPINVFNESYVLPTVLKLVSPNQVTINTGAGTITVTLTDAQTLNMLTSDNAYSLVVTTSDGESHRLYEGYIKIFAGVEQ